MILLPGAAIQSSAIHTRLNEIEVTIQVQCELHRSNQPHAPPRPRRPGQPKLNQILFQIHVHEIHLIGTQRNRRGLDLVSEFDEAVLPDVEGRRDKLGDLEAVEAEDEGGVVEAGVSLGVVVLPLDRDADLGGEDAGLRVLEEVEVRVCDGDKGDSRPYRDVAGEDDDSGDYHRHRYHGAEYGHEPDEWARVVDFR